MGNGFLDDLPDLGLERAGKNPAPAEPLRKKKQTSEKEELFPPVIYSKVKCPRCKSEKVPVYDSSHLPVRYHKCKKCGHTFKSIEK